MHITFSDDITQLQITSRLRLDDKKVAAFMFFEESIRFLDEVRTLSAQSTPS